MFVFWRCFAAFLFLLVAAVGMGPSFLPSFWLVCGALGLPPARVSLFLLLDEVCFFGALGLLPALGFSSSSLNGCGLWSVFVFWRSGASARPGVFFVFFGFLPHLFCFSSCYCRGPPQQQQQQQQKEQEQVAPSRRA